MASNSTIPSTSSSDSSSSSLFSSSSSSTPATTKQSTSQSSSSQGSSSTLSTSQSQTTTSPSSSQTPSESFSTSLDITTSNGNVKTITQVVTSTAPPTVTPSQTGGSTSSSASGSAAAGLQNIGSGSGGGGLSRGGVVAVAVVVPIVGVALLVLAALFLWRKHKARKDAEELRRKEVEEYGYNPNNDPTLPAVSGSAGNDGPFEMREDGSSGYRGWGNTTAVGSTGRKASTTISGGQSAGGMGMAYSEGTSPTQGPMSDTRSDNALIGEGHPGETEALGAMGPAASGNRSGDINRGPSNASSSYSAAGRSDGSGEIGGFGSGQYNNNQYDSGNPYNGETSYGSPPGRAEMSAQPIIRDVQARRNTRIENPAHFPQQSAGIAQNF